MEYKFNFPNKQKAIEYLHKKGIINAKKVEDDNGKEVWTAGKKTARTHAVVWVGKIVDTPAEYDEQGQKIKKATFKKGYHVDVMLKDTEDFGSYKINVKTPNHKFA